MDKPIGFFKEGGKTKPITKRKAKKRERVVRRKPVSHSDMASNAQVAEITRKLALNFSDRGEPVRVLFHDDNSKFSATEGYDGLRVNLPQWSGFELGVDGYDTWIIYRQGTWHESQHLKFSPLGVYELVPDIPGLDPKICRALVNIIEDRRVNDLGAKDHVGAIPGRKHEQGYAYYRRGKMLGPLDQIEPPEAQIFEAFVQKLLIGRMNGSIPPEYEKIVDKTVAHILKELKKMNKHGAKSEKITPMMDKLTKKAADMLKLVQGPPLPPDGSGPDGDGPDGDGPGQGMICPHCGEDMLQNALMSSVRTGKITCPHCGEQTGITASEAKGNEKGIQWDDKDFPVVEWDETFTPMDKKEADKSRKEAKDKIEEFFDEEQEEAEKEGKKKRGKDSDPDATYADDVEKARKGTEEARAEFDRIKKGGDEAPEIKGEFIPLTDVEDTTRYRDPGFKRDMSKRLKTWRTGAKAETAKSGRRVSPRAFVAREKEPFRRLRRKSVKGKKYLFVLDFSDSISYHGSCETEYKKAIINTLEALDEIGAKTAVFGFGKFDIGGTRAEGHFKVKDFKEARWRPVHAQKVAGVRPGGGTPTAEAYSKLRRYIRKEKPEYVITLTDGEANDRLGVKNMNGELGKHTRMVAFGIAADGKVEEQMKAYLDAVKYDRSFTVTRDNINEIPKQLIDMIAPEE